VAGKQAFFLTGANGKILVNNKVIAYATDITYRISVKHGAPRVLGRFEVETIQPLTYDVAGTLSIIRYARGIQPFVNGPDDVNQEGNGIGSLSRASGLGDDFTKLSLPSIHGQYNGGADEAFNPARFFQSKMFNIEIRQKLPDSGDGLVSETTVTLLRDCRFEDMIFKLSKRGVAMIDLTFRARYADDDTGLARKSGVGQELV